MITERPYSRFKHLTWVAFLYVLTQYISSAQDVLAPISDSSKLVWQGSSVTIQAGCSDATGFASASLTVLKLPRNLASLNFTCKVVSWPLAQNAFGLGWEDSLDKATSSRISVLEELRNGTQIPAILFGMEGNPSKNGSEKDANTNTFMANCRIPASPPNSTIVLLAKDKDGKFVGVEPKVPLSRSSFDSVSPLLGPAGGGTNVTIKGQGLSDPVNCTFSNSTRSIQVPASRLNSSTIICTAPSWRSDLGNPEFLSVGLAGNELISLLVSSGNCATRLPFQLYSEPKVLGVSPLQGPRYGSFDLRVNLAYSLSSFPQDGMESMQPAIRIKGGDLNGSDLILSAILASDRMGLLASTPLERAPLATGNHQVHVSLNGQQFADQASIKSTVLTVEGPTLYISEPYYTVEKDAHSVNLTVALQGESNLPVSVEISATLRSLSGSITENSSETGLNFSLSQSKLEWAPGENEPKLVQIILEGDLTILSSGGIIVGLNASENADISELKTTSIVSRMPRQDLMVGFEFEPDQVVYRGMNASLPIIIQNAAMRLPATIEYSIVGIDGSVPTYLGLDQLSGVLEWDFELGSLLELELNIDWENVSLHTEDHLLLKFGDGWNARALNDPNSVALHVYGVENGQCPPGTFRIDRAEAPSPSSSLQDIKSTPGWLNTIQVQDADSWYSEPLSSQFQPEIPEYGVILQDGVKKANLCLEPKPEYSGIKVIDSSGNIMQQDIGIVPSAYFTPGPASTVLGRKLEQSPSYLSPLSQFGSRMQIPSPQPQDTCRGLTWILPLQTGQNVYSIAHGDTPVKAPPPTMSNGGRLNGTSKTYSTPPSQSILDMTYSLSVVLLANRSHAEILELNVTAGNDTFTVCSDVRSNSESSNYWHLDVPICTPSSTMYVNVSYETAIISLHPSLRYPYLQNIRVEVAGQVLSQGGNVGADQIADTSDIITERSNTSFLPLAYIVGLQPGNPVEIPIVVVAEDGVTSLRYYLSVYRALSPKEEDKDDALYQIYGDENEDSDVLGVTLTVNHDLISPPPPPAIPVSAQAHANWPLAPSKQQFCRSCLAGWASTKIDQPHCTMCTPGSFSEGPQSPECSLCTNGTYTNSWGSTNCNHCIMGTFAPYQGSRLCFMCPENLTNMEDGSYDCDIPVRPGTNLLMRYAVIVSFGVYFNGTSLETIASKVGVNASSTKILERLISTDTASAFNITARDVNVTGIRQVGRRVLLVNVTATLGLDLPSNSSNTDVKTELAVKNLSADEAMHMLSLDADKFFARTTKALDVTAAQGDSPASRVESRPKGARGSSLIPWYAILLILLGGFGVIGIAIGVWRRKSNRYRCWPRKGREYVNYNEGGSEDGENVNIGARGLGTLVSRGRNLATLSQDNLPILNQTLSSSSQASL